MCRLYELIAKEDQASEEDVPYDYHDEAPLEEDVYEDEEQEWCD